MNADGFMQRYLASIPNNVLLERGMDDNTYWFTDEVDQLLKHRQPAPLGLANAAGITKPQAQVTRVPSATTVTSHLCSETGMVKQSFLLEPLASVRVFLDAWLPYQTVPIVVFVRSLSSTTPVRYAWEFANYVPIGNAPRSGRGLATYCPQGDEEAPVIRTYGHTSRSPTGEFPLSRETLERQCVHEHERPTIHVQNVEARSSMVVTVAIGV